ncbi:MAG: hypothetical protein JKY81_02395 [Colwellia sp.]|nr:hypothetical protein [Colwellia sp.]
MTPLTDGDIFLYELGACGEYYEPVEEGEEKGELIIRSFEFVQKLIDGRIEEICDAVGATEDPIFFFTGKGNFRFEVAKTSPYKGNRKDVVKPYHHKNIKIYLESMYECHTSTDCEADDEIVMAQMADMHVAEGLHATACWEVEEGGLEPPLDHFCTTVICTRDKDLRMCPGLHYGWECGLQPEFQLQWVTELGDLRPKFKTKLNKKGEEVEYLDKLDGTGIRWFYAQLLMGDMSTDNIPGCPGIGKVKAYEYLKNFDTEYDLYSACADIYKEVCRKKEIDYKELLLEQAYLLWMVRGRDANNQLIMWEPPLCQK